MVSRASLPAVVAAIAPATAELPVVLDVLLVPVPVELVTPVDDDTVLLLGAVESSADGGSTGPASASCTALSAAIGADPLRNVGGWVGG